MVLGSCQFRRRTIEPILINTLSKPTIGLVVLRINISCVLQEIYLTLNIFQIIKIRIPKELSIIEDLQNKQGVKNYFSNI